MHTASLFRDSFVGGVRSATNMHSRRGYRPKMIWPTFSVVRSGRTIIEYELRSISIVSRLVPSSLQARSRSRSSCRAFLRVELGQQTLYASAPTRPSISVEQRHANQNLQILFDQRLCRVATLQVATTTPIFVLSWLDWPGWLERNAFLFDFDITLKAFREVVR